MHWSALIIYPEKVLMIHARQLVSLLWELLFCKSLSCSVSFAQLENKLLRVMLWTPDYVAFSEQAYVTLIFSPLCSRWHAWDTWKLIEACVGWHLLYWYLHNYVYLLLREWLGDVGLEESWFLRSRPVSTFGHNGMEKVQDKPGKVIGRRRLATWCWEKPAKRWGK